MQVTILENRWIPYDPTLKQAEFLLREYRELLYGGAAGGGEALWVDELIPTPDGWKRMGDIQVGDYVFDKNGNPTKVVAVSEIMLNRPCYNSGAFSFGREREYGLRHAGYRKSPYTSQYLIEKIFSKKLDSIGQFPI